MSPDPDARLAEAEAAAQQAGRLARVALIVASVAAALAVLGLFLPVDL